MKQYTLICLLALCFFMFTSCTDDDAPANVASSSVSAKIGGVDIMFNDVSVRESTYQDGGETFIDLFVTAKMSNDSSKEFQFNIDQGIVGSNDIFFFLYESGDTIYDFEDTQPIGDTAIMSSATLENTSSRLRGTFSGTLTSYNAVTMEYTSVTVSNGSFDVHH